MTAIHVRDEHPTLRQRIQYANDNGEPLWEKDLLPLRRDSSPNAVSAALYVNPREFTLGAGAATDKYREGGDVTRTVDVFVHLGPIALCLEYRAWVAGA